LKERDVRMRGWTILGTSGLLVASVVVAAETAAEVAVALAKGNKIPAGLVNQHVQ
jgi:hypothetical protein